MDIPSQYEPKEVEERWGAAWIEKGVFHADENEPTGKPSYTVVIPPPNVTGALHIGHALNNTLQDILIRFKRMDGFNALWMPGTDHAGIATQNVVERKLASEGTDRHALGRDAFVEQVWDWKAIYGGRIINQLKRIGASCDWERERFTMDEGLSKAVREVFVTLYDEGLIYKGEYIINWCPRCHTALSDIEVEHEEKAGNMWHITYPVEGSDASFVIATTRPETLLGDTAVAVHPDDERYKHLIGKNVLIPLINRAIPIIADEYVDMAFGSGGLKVTPAHDPNDFLLGRKHDLPLIKIFDKDAVINENGGPYKGLDRYVARKQIVDDLEEAGLLVKVDEHNHAVGACYRCASVVEPDVSPQWFVKIAPLAAPAIEAVKSGEVKFVPQHWENLYFDWMENIRDWCISRQLWWGHRIPAWSCADCGHMTVHRTDPTACAKCGSSDIAQEEDVLDTWFSSALWPFSTQGWPEKTATLDKFYPTSTLVTSFDIIFFWVARMIMMGKKFTGQAPFKDVYIHALVRDAEGKKMSKSSGNTIDPLDVMEKFGADAMRMTLAALAAQGRDIKLAEERIEGYRNFCNKLWNASRFALMNLEGFDMTTTDVDRDDLALADRWILSRLNQTIVDVRKALDDYKFNEVANALYRFTWNEVCDWYLELSKPRLSGREPGKEAAQHTLAHVMESTMRLLHPIMPFITEELWQRFKPSGDMVTTAAFPKVDASRIDDAIEADMGVVMEVIVAIRNIKGELSVKPSQTVSASLFTGDKTTVADVVTRQAPFINTLTKATITLIDSLDDKPVDFAVGMAAGCELFVDLAGLVDMDERKKKIEKELAKLEKEIAVYDKKLSNERFVANAPPEVVEKDRLKLAKFKEEAEKLRAYL